MISEETLKKMGILISPADVKRNIKLIIEAPCIIGAGTKFSYGAEIGAYTYFRGGDIGSLGRIGRFCSVAPEVIIGPGNHPTNFLSTHPFQYGASGFDFWKDFREFKHSLSLPKETLKKAPLIGNDVWIGARVFIGRGVSIGDGAVIAAGSVVTRDVKPYEIVAGTPARHLRFRFDVDTIKRLRKISWWNYDPKSMTGIDFSSINHALDELELRKENGSLIALRAKKYFLENDELYEMK
ncbi:2,3,4,5-tetrahydropyridine-2,6-dicarboxylate N-acetyltransferase [Comamonas sp. PE63]|jgi:acetyltransferase-like isoleucine patch superfamily enzyme|uniref:2,3,4,5-tetrahydropyridine-2,6-dicarboxylate N-acetyltransferase n=1 Tax=Comamonas brasiliensis TaxID=1812482 RepID=A0ABS5LQS5_9BURK|nr:CatB-related O-acetyltransferase [Comamonas sp. PE63]MBS3018858.1 2,3,4,5-tetrahydropyridine-2,6-dicarboxylate N-acetyltransferase [Comamonas sp. PE63]